MKNKAGELLNLHPGLAVELRAYYNEQYINISNEVYDSILKKIPEQNPNWLLSLCVELIDYYIDLLKEYYKGNDK